MRNPLNKRIFRDLKSNIGRYGAIFIIMLITISVVSSFFIAQKSIEKTYYDSHKLGRIEDGYIEFDRKLTSQEEKIFTDNGVRAYPNYFMALDYDKGKTIRVYQNREKIDIPAIHEGKMPRNSEEIFLNVNFARENKLKISDKISLLGQEFKISGIGAFPDYSCLLRRPGDLLMDNKNFGVASLSSGGFDRLVKSGAGLKYSYSYRHGLDDGKRRDKTNQYDKNRQGYKYGQDDKKLQTDKLKDIIKGFSSKGIIPIDAQTKYTNSRISYVMDDMGGDVPMITSLMVIVLLVMSFIFAVLVQNMIEEESAVIGTLLAFGYKRPSLVWHYIKLPLYVTVFSALLGNIFAYTFMKDMYLSLYTISYSLFPVELVWSAYAFILTTLIPIGLMLLVNLVFITRKLRMSPLKFLRRDLSRSRNKKAVKLPNVSFISRFRLRIFLRNKGNYLVLLLGLLLANILMIYGMSIKGILNDYMDKTQEFMPSSYQTVFKGPIRKEVEERLKDSLSKKDKNIFDHPSYDYQNKLVGGKVDTNLFTLYQVKIRGKKVDDQTRASIYGTDLDGSYVKDGLKRNNIKNISTRSSEGKTYDVYVTEGIKDKFGLGIGDYFTVNDENRDREYRMRIVGTSQQLKTSFSIIMDRKSCNKMLGMDEFYYNGAFSDRALKIDDKDLSTLIDGKSMRKIADQFLNNFKNVMPAIMMVALVIYLVVMYVLTKSIIDKYKESISYLRIFGYHDKEIEKIFIRVSSLAVVIFLLILIPVEKYLVNRLIKVAFYKFNGYVNADIPMYIYFATIACGILVYMVDRWILTRRIKKINMTDVLKDR